MTEQSSQSQITTAEVPKIYIPKDSFTLDKYTTEQQIRLGIQGAPGDGKTFSALTFPNPVPINLDRGLGAHQGRKDVIEIPLWRNDFVNKLVPISGGKVQRKDAIIKWLTTEAVKLTAEQTLVLDSTTQLQYIYHQWFDEHPELKIGRKGTENAFAEWGYKLDFFGEVYEIIKNLSCNIVSISHEQDDYDETGTKCGVKALITGSFSGAIASHCTDWFRMICVAKPKDDNTKASVLAKYCQGSESMLKEFIDSTSANMQCFYLWQTQSDNIFKAKVGSLIQPPKFIIANYTSFSKYKRKQT